MLVLGIETSGQRGSVALLQDGRRLGKRNLEPSLRRHAQTLVLEIDRLFSANGKDPKQCDLVAVSLGPGSFTGLRVGVVCAKTMAYATGCQLIGVETLLAVAANSPENISTVEVVSNAQRSELFVARFQRDAANTWQASGEVRIVGVESWVNSLNSDMTVSGPGLLKVDPDELKSTGATVLAEQFWNPRAGVIAQIGIEQSSRCRAETVWELEPLYLRKSAAEEKWDAAGK